MPDTFLLALDQGTTSSRALLFDLGGRIVGSSQREFRQYYPQPGWVEHDPAEIWSSQLGCLEELLARTGVGLDRIAAVGIANQRETTLLWERATGRPVYPAIVWQDRRTADECRRLEQNGAADWVAARTGLRLDPYFSATKLRWILDHVPGARRAAEAGELAFGTVDTWLLWQLTGGKVHATDASNAARTLLMNLHRGEWDPELLALFSIPAAVLPAIRATSGTFGSIAASLPGAGLRIASLVGDQQAALFGQGCHAPGSAKATYGTGCFLLQNTGPSPIVSRHRLLTTVAWRIDGVTTFALEGSVFSAGAAIQWLRDELRLIGSARELDELAASVGDTAGAYLVPAFAGLGAPHWDPDARGAIVGLTRGTQRAHICRAALEAIAFQTAELLEAMEQDAALVSPELRVDGGAARSAPLLQIQADLIGRPVVRTASVEATALGAAWLAGCDAGVVAPEGVATGADVQRTLPQLAAAAAARRRAEWLHAVTRTKGWTNASA